MSEIKSLRCPVCRSTVTVSYNTQFGFVPWCENEDCIFNESTKGYETEKQAIQEWLKYSNKKRTNRVELVESETLLGLEARINEFAERHDIISVSLSTHRDYTYCACILYSKEQ